MKVTLLTSTPNAETIVIKAAKLCYSEKIPTEVKESDYDLLRKILSMGHFSVLEHASFTFSIEGVSRALSHQLVRHRIASFSQQSQRYVKAIGALGIVVPPEIGKNQYLLDKYSVLCYDIMALYNEMISLGVPKEDARYILPNAAETKLVMTMNARELQHFFSLRCCVRAQWEIREMAEKVMALCKEVAPVIFATAGKPCLFGECKEGKLGCKGETK